jgi:hypothetical protein
VLAHRGVRVAFGEEFAAPVRPYLDLGREGAPVVSHENKILGDLVLPDSDLAHALQVDTQFRCVLPALDG